MTTPPEHPPVNAAMAPNRVRFVVPPHQAYDERARKYRARVGPCPCACNSGGFCGGCGHGGCGGR